jgi:hypothetical protein
LSSAISQSIGAVHETAYKSSTTTDFIHTMLENGCFFFFSMSQRQNQHGD